MDWLKIIYKPIILFFFQGEENLTIYQFGTMKAKHIFCKTCGVQSFYIPRSNPDSYGMRID